MKRGGEQHRKYRKLLNKGLSSTAVGRLISLQEKSAQSLLEDLLSTPEDFLNHIRFSVGRMIVELSYGHDLRIGDSEYIDEAERAHEVFARTAKTFAFWVDLIPIRTWCSTGYSRQPSVLIAGIVVKYVPTWLPGAGFKREAKQWRQQLDQLAHTPFNIVKDEVVSFVLLYHFLCGPTGLLACRIHHIFSECRFSYWLVRGRPPPESRIPFERG